MPHLSGSVAGKGGYPEDMEGWSDKVLINVNTAIFYIYFSPIEF
jgi:hypothetical protein